MRPATITVLASLNASPTNYLARWPGDWWTLPDFVHRIRYLISEQVQASWPSKPPKSWAQREGCSELTFLKECWRPLKQNHRDLFRVRELTSALWMQNR